MITQQEINEFWKQIEFSDDHWFWKGYIRPNNQLAIFRFDNKEYSAKKFCYIIHNNFIDTGHKRIITMCGNKKCINPKHLQLHGMASTRELSCYEDIISRILRPNHKWYPLYGGRGIDIDPRYNPDIYKRDVGFLNFYNDLKELKLFPIPDGYSIDRKDNNKGYWKENLRLATFAEQAQNRSTTILNEINIIYIREQYNKGLKNQRELSEEFNITEVAICNILNNKRWKNV